MNSKVIAALAAALGGAGGFVAGALARQPEINKLHKQVRRLQSGLAELEGVVEEQNAEIAELLVRYKALKVFQFAKRRELRGDIQEGLEYQYAAADYLTLLMDCASTGAEMGGEDAAFYRAFGKALSEKPLSEAEKSTVRDYVWGRHRRELEALQGCDTQPVLDRIREFGADDAPKGRGPFKGRGPGAPAPPAALLPPDLESASRLRREFDAWVSEGGGKPKDLGTRLDGLGYELLSPRPASLSGFGETPALDALVPGDVLSVASGPDGRSLLLADSSGTGVGYVSGGRGYVAKAMRALGESGSVYGVVEGRDGGKSGGGNRVHVLLVARC